MTAAPALVRLKTRPQFLKLAAQGNKAVRPTLILQALPLREVEQTRAKIIARQPHLADAIFLGFTASKKVGNAIARNRAKRRLTALSREVLPKLAPTGWAFVIIARRSSVGSPFAKLDEDLRKALSQVLTSKSSRNV